jgi:hypothetical protein
MRDVQIVRLHIINILQEKKLFLNSVIKNYLTTALNCQHIGADQ